MELNIIPEPNIVQKAGTQVLNFAAGDKIKIETQLAAGGGEEILEYAVPAGRASDVSLSVFISERSA